MLFGHIFELASARYIDSFTEGSNLYIAMEHADGGDLAKEIESRRSHRDYFAESEAVHIFGEILSALQHVHSKKILHRCVVKLEVCVANSFDLKCAQKSLLQR